MKIIYFTCYLLKWWLIYDGVMGIGRLLRRKVFISPPKFHHILENEVYSNTSRIFFYSTEPSYGRFCSVPVFLIVDSEIVCILFIANLNSQSLFWK